MPDTAVSKVEIYGVRQKVDLTLVEGRSAYALRGSGGTSPPVRCVALAKQGVGYTPKRFNLTRELE